MTLALRNATHRLKVYANQYTEPVDSPKSDTTYLADSSLDDSKIELSDYKDRTEYTNIDVENLRSLRIGTPIIAYTIIGNYVGKFLGYNRGSGKDNHIYISQSIKPHSKVKVDTCNIIKTMRGKEPSTTLQRNRHAFN